MGLNHLQSLICTYSADDLRPLMWTKNVPMLDSRLKTSAYLLLVGPKLPTNCLNLNKFFFLDVFQISLANFHLVKMSLFYLCIFYPSLTSFACSLSLSFIGIVIKISVLKLPNVSSFCMI